MSGMNSIFIAMRLRSLRNPVADCPGIAMLFSGDTHRISGIVVTNAPTFGVAHRTSVPISRGDPPTP